MRNNKVQQFCTLAVAVLFGAFATANCGAGMFDKVDKALKSATSVTKGIARTNAQTQAAGSQLVDQADQRVGTNSPRGEVVAEPQKDNVIEQARPMDSEMPSQTQSPESKTNQTSNPANAIKAYKTLNFGDDVRVVLRKLAEITGGEAGNYNEAVGYAGLEMSVAVQSSLFDTVGEHEPDLLNKTYPPEFFGADVGIDVVLSKNSSISVGCYHLGSRLPDVRLTNGLAIVEVVYAPNGSTNIAESFSRSFPGAQREEQTFRIESEIYPGVFLEFKRVFLSDVNSERRAKLSLPTDAFTFTLVEPAKFSPMQSKAWETLLHADQSEMLKKRLEALINTVETSFAGLSPAEQVDVRGLIEKMETLCLQRSKPATAAEFLPLLTPILLRLAKNMSMNKNLDGFTLELFGWDSTCISKVCEPLIYGPPKAVFASKVILDPLISGHRRSVAAEAERERIKRQKENEAATKF